MIDSDVILQLIRDFMRQTVERQHNTWFRDQ
ncbi:TPA: toxin-antitoxin system protein, partial [Escherichia coli]|nr:toxin-antitoxin system protein [Escherichia coli]